MWRAASVRQTSRFILWEQDVVALLINAQAVYCPLLERSAYCSVLYSEQSG